MKNPQAVGPSLARPAQDLFIEHQWFGWIVWIETRAVMRNTQLIVRAETRSQADAVKLWQRASPVE